jgi:uncharacterized membrane protein
MYGLHKWLLWNIFLGAIPYLLSLYLFPKKGKLIRTTQLWSIVFTLFILFLPNAPYLITDIMHLFTGSPHTIQDGPVISFFSILSSAIIGAVLFVLSYDNFEMYAKREWSLKEKMIRIPMFILIAVGVYFGRFLRLNSWDALVRPEKTIQSVLELVSIQGIIYVGLFTLLELGLFYLYKQFTWTTVSSVKSQKKKHLR